MLHKILFNSVISLIIVFIFDMITTLKVEAERDINTNSLIYRFCIARLKSKIELIRKENFNEISKLTCGCFLKKYKSGHSLKNSRIYCQNIAIEKYNL